MVMKTGKRKVIREVRLGYGTSAVSLKANSIINVVDLNSDINQCLVKFGPKEFEWYMIPTIESISVEE